MIENLKVMVEILIQVTLLQYRNYKVRLWILMERVEANSNLTKLTQQGSNAKKCWILT